MHLPHLFTRRCTDYRLDFGLASNSHFGLLRARGAELKRIPAIGIGLGGGLYIFVDFSGI